MAGQTLVSLPLSTIRLIGSGQVITSVYSVVKELVENSVDAGCTTLDIKLDGYGLDKIEVSDNGHGIKILDVPYMAKRHYTSKLKTVEDLQSLETYGFRGEALASLCAVADVTITTKTSNDDLSYVYEVDNEGNIKGKKPSHLGNGTTVTAHNLFRNLPVRKQYYNTSQRKKDDLKRIEDLLIAFGIIRPQLRITLRHDREIAWQKTQAKDIKEALQSVLSRQVFSHLLYVDKHLEEPKGRVYAYVPKPGSDIRLMSHTSGDRTLIVINDRPVHVKELIKVVKQYYNNCHACEGTRYPICYVYIQLPASDVDINVDPNKTTVFLRHLNEVRNSLEELLLKVYGPLDNVPAWHYSEPLDGAPVQKSGDNSNAVVSKIVKKVQPPTEKSSVPRDSEIYDNHGISPTSIHVQECTNNKSLPNVTVTLHNNIKSSNKCDGELRNSDEQICSPANAECSRSEPSAAENKYVETVKDWFSEDTEIRIFPEHFVSCSASSKDLRSEKPEAELVGLPPVLSNILQDSCSNEMIISSEVLHLEDSSRTLETLSNDQTSGTLQPLLVDLAEDNPANNFTSSEIRRSEISSRSWSMGHSLLAANGAHLEPVQLICQSPKHIPEKRSHSLVSNSSNESLAKHRRISENTVPSGQLTLTDMSTDHSVGKEAYELFCMEKRPVVMKFHSYESRESVDKKLEEDWQNLTAIERAKFRERSIQESERQEKKVISKKSDTKERKDDSVKSDIQDRAVSKTSGKKSVKRRYPSEKFLEFDVMNLKAAMVRTETNRIFYEKPTVIGEVKSCDVLICGLADKLYLVNTHRLGEAVLFRKLMDKHRLSAKPLQALINLRPRLESEKLWSVLEELARVCQTRDMYFHITDDRLVANGFNIRCHKGRVSYIQ